MLAAHTHTRLPPRPIWREKKRKRTNKQIDNFNYVNGRKVIANRLIVSLAALQFLWIGWLINARTSHICTRFIDMAYGSDLSFSSVARNNDKFAMRPCPIIMIKNDDSFAWQMRKILSASHRSSFVDRNRRRDRLRIVNLSIDHPMQEIIICSKLNALNRKRVSASVYRCIHGALTYKHAFRFARRQQGSTHTHARAQQQCREAKEKMKEIPDFVECKELLFAACASCMQIIH